MIESNTVETEVEDTVSDNARGLDAAEALTRRVLRSAWVTLTVCTLGSAVGSVYYAYRHGSGTAAAMVSMGSVAVILWLSMHLRGGLSAARRASLMPTAAYRTAATGVGVLVVIALAASYYTLHALMVAEQIAAVPAALIPAAVDVGVIVSTISIFALDRAVVTVERADQREASAEQSGEARHGAVHGALVERATAPVTVPHDAPETRPTAPAKRPTERSGATEPPQFEWTPEIAGREVL
ncbi:MAG TPA: hypothetical protein PLX85_09620, partial [Dehalococcoidia bacterium]|nr:hypothetical protein [Dehalococcoidia bacterium]